MHRNFKGPRHREISPPECESVRWEGTTRKRFVFYFQTGLRARGDLWSRMNISRLVSRGILASKEMARVYIRPRVLWIVPRLWMSKAVSPYRFGPWIRLRLYGVYRAETRQPQGLPGSLLNSRESPHEFPCQTSEGRGHSRARELLTSLACCKIPSTSGPLDFFLSFFFVNSNRLSLFYRRRENIKAVIFLWNIYSSPYIVIRLNYFLSFFFFFLHLCSRLSTFLIYVFTRIKIPNHSYTGIK